MQIRLKTHTAGIYTRERKEWEAPNSISKDTVLQTKTAKFLH